MSRALTHNSPDLTLVQVDDLSGCDAPAPAEVVAIDDDIFREREKKEGIVERALKFLFDM